MKIVSHGKFNAVDQPKEFKCSVCYCVFVAEPNEYNKECYLDLTYYGCDCPECGSRITLG